MHIPKIGLLLLFIVNFLHLQGASTPNNSNNSNHKPNKADNFSHLERLKKTTITTKNFSDAHKILPAIRNLGKRRLLQFLNKNRDIDLNLLYTESDTSEAISPLQLAVDLGKIGRVDALIKFGAALDRGNHSKPLMLVALLNKDYAMMNYLCRHTKKIRSTKSNNYIEKNNYKGDCIDLNFHDSIYFWPPKQASLSVKQKTEFFKLFDTHYFHTKKPQERLSKASQLDRIELIDHAILQGGKVNAFDQNGSTPLHWAASSGRIYAIAQLLKKGAKPNIKDKAKKRTPLQWLIRMHRTAHEKSARLFSTSEFLAALFLLRAYGANPKIKDGEGKTPSYWLKKHKFNSEETKLINEVLNLSPDVEKRKATLEKIYDFQRNELENSANDGLIDISSSTSGARYYWHRPEWMRMRNAWVKNDDDKAFKSIYHEHIYM